MVVCCGTHVVVDRRGQPSCAAGGFDQPSSVVADGTGIGGGAVGSMSGADEKVPSVDTVVDTVAVMAAVVVVVVVEVNKRTGTSGSRRAPPS